MATIVKETVKKRSLFSRGLGIQGQLGYSNKFRNGEEFRPVDYLSDVNITHLGGDHSQNFVVLNSQTLICWGWPLCTKTTYKYIDLYEKFPRIVWLYQNFFPFLKSGYQQPMIELEFESPIIKKIDLGGGFIGVLDEDGKTYLWGDNYAGQLGLGDDVHRDHPIINKTLFDQHIVDISGGFQHILFLSKEGSVFGVGKNDRFQLGKEKKEADESGEITGRFGLPSKIKGFSESTEDQSNDNNHNERIVQIQAGKFHSLFLSELGNVYALGNNMHGQLGFSSYLYKSAERPTQLMLEGIKVKQIASGFHHNLILSEEGKVYGFGSDAVGQITARKKADHQGYLSIHTTGKDLPLTEIKLPTEAKGVKVMANNVRSCAVMDNGEIWFWGGYFYANKRRKKLFIDDFNLLNEEEGVPHNGNIVDYQMGFAHDVIMTEDSQEISLEGTKDEIAAQKGLDHSQIV